jgi:hypothetical protein
MGSTPEPTGDPEAASSCRARRRPTTGTPTGSPVGRDAPKRRRDLRSLGRTAGHGLVQGLASATGGAIVTGLIWWNQR